MELLEQCKLEFTEQCERLDAQLAEKQQSVTEDFRIAKSAKQRM